MLSIRLQAILNFIDQNDKVADIGTDHGYLLEACINKGITFGQGVENKKGPYDRALLTLNTHIKNNKIKLSLSDGLDDLDDNIDTIVIAGMGGELIFKIIDANIEKAKKVKKLILEPNIKIFELREYLSDNSFEIINEDIVEDNNKFYEIIVVKYNPKCFALNEQEKMFGPILIKNKPLSFIHKWQYRIKQINDIFTKNNQVVEELQIQLNKIMEVVHD